MKLTEDQLWQLVKNAKWESDHNYDRIRKEYMTLPEEVHEQLKDFVHKKSSDLYSRYEQDWIGDPGIRVSDDGWDDLRAEVVGRGKEFYESISVEKLREMADTRDFDENFQYSLHRDEE